MKNHILVPVAIILAGGFIAVAVYFINKQPATAPAANKNLTANDIRPVDATDHVRGNPNAPIKLIEYSDFECPYCKVYETTLEQVMADYGAKGQVAWVFRHFPIYELHSKAPKEAEASECVAELGGNDAFWKFTDRLYEITPSENGLDLSILPDIAAQAAGVNREAFVSCLASGKYAKKVQDQREEIMKTGAQGTPHIVINVRGDYLPLPGAQPIGALRSAINEILTQIGGSPTVNVPTASSTKTQ